MSEAATKLAPDYHVADISLADWDPADASA